MECSLLSESLYSADILHILVRMCYRHELQPNLALLKATQLSTTLDSYTSTLAVDGADVPTLSFGRCAASNPTDSNPWLMIDLHTEQRISTVVIANADTYGMFHLITFVQVGRKCIGG